MTPLSGIAAQANDPSASAAAVPRISTVSFVRAFMSLSPSVSVEPRRSPLPALSRPARLALPALRRAHDRVTDLGRAVAVLERRTVRGDVTVRGDRVQHVMELVHERVAPADDVAGRPPVCPERIVGLADESCLEPACAITVGAEYLELVQALHVERERALRPVDLPLEGVAPAERKARRLDRADGAVLELDRSLDRIVDLPPGHERRDEPGDAGDLAVHEPREVDHVRAAVAERSR